MSKLIFDYIKADIREHFLSPQFNEVESIRFIAENKKGDPNK